MPRRNFRASEEGRWTRSVLWTVGGLALGGLIAAVLGIVVLWVHPAVRSARSPLRAVVLSDLTVYYVRSSPLAAEVTKHASEVQREWHRVLDTLGVARAEIRVPIHVYLCADLDELATATSARLAGEGVQLGSVDLLWGQPLATPLSRLACSLAFGRPGNPVLRRGLPLYVTDPSRPWAAEAQAWSSPPPWSVLWERAEQLLPPDPFDRLYFAINAPWGSAAPSLELIRAILQVPSELPATGLGRMWESMAGALAQWAVATRGRHGIEAMWQATSWQSAAAALGLDTQAMREALDASAAEALAQSPRSAYLRGVTHLFQGHARAALEELQGVPSDESADLVGLALFALGDPAAAAAAWEASRPGVLLSIAQSLAGAPHLEDGRFLAVGAPTTAAPSLRAARQAVERTLDLWELSEQILPDRVVFYFVSAAPSVTVPPGVVWVAGSPEVMPALGVRVVLDLITPYGLPAYKTFIEGLVLHLAWPDRDFRTEAANVMRSNQWVPLSQPLFGVYPLPVAEAQAGALVRFIADKYGNRAVRDLWSRLADGASVFSAVEQVLGLRLSDFEQTLQAWVRQP